VVSSVGLFSKLATKPAKPIIAHKLCKYIGNCIANSKFLVGNVITNTIKNVDMY
jgi:hypothetical protein